MTDPTSKIPLEWLYARQREIARTQNRYLLLLLLGSAYTLAAHLTPGPTINVPFLGLGVGRALVETFAVTALSVLLLAFYGTGVRLTHALRDIHERLGAEGANAVDCLVDETANVLDYLGTPATAPTRVSPARNVASSDETSKSCSWIRTAMEVSLRSPVETGPPRRRCR